MSLKRSRLFVLLASLALAACAQAENTAAPAATSTVSPGEPVAVSSVAVDLRSADPKDLRLGSLIYRGGISVVPGDHADLFGGMSAFKVSADGTHFVSLSDQGHWITGALTYDASSNLSGVADIRVAPMLDETGKPLEGKKEGDSEGLAFADPFDLKGDAYVSYERDHRILRYDFAKDGVAARGSRIEAPAGLQTLGENEGIEALASLGGNVLLAIAEQGPADPDADSPAWLIDSDKHAFTGFTVKRNLPFAMTDATLLPDARVLTLERSFTVLTGPAAEIRLWDPASFQEGVTVAGKVIATLAGGVTVDNMEGIAARKTADGKTLIYICSDDNFQRPLQRTLIMMFELAE